MIRLRLAITMHGPRGLSAVIPLVLALAAFVLWTAPAALAVTPGTCEHAPAATILVYHRFGPIVADSMTVRTRVFAWQLQYLHDHGYTVVPLPDVVKFLTAHGHLPACAVAITADDGHITVFTVMKPLVERYRIPVTLFIYPSAISNASYAMTWDQLAALKATGLFSIESHTYWHPNFRTEKKRLSADAYRALVQTQLRKSRQVLESRFGGKVDMLAWPFGIYDDELIAAAANAGYVAAFSIDRRNVSPTDNVMAIPRFIVTDGDTGKAFAMLLSGESSERTRKGPQAADDPG